jgi:two-component system NtrC family sensor kinase
MTNDPPNAPFHGIPRGLRVLCVDDESMIGDLVAHILRTHLHLEVAVAHSGTEALRILAKQSFDLVIVDYVMPGMDGGELYQEIERRYPDVIPRFMFITGDTLSPTTLAFISSTDRRLLEKPFGLPELTGAIREMLAVPAADRPGG